jgi:hypothetical protein
MNHKRPPLPAIFILILIIGFSIYFIATQTADDQNGALTASGAIEAAQVDIAPELAGKVTEVLVEEGQPVTKDSALLRLDPSLLTAQRAVASAQWILPTPPWHLLKPNMTKRSKPPLPRKLGSVPQIGVLHLPVNLTSRIGTSNSPHRSPPPKLKWILRKLKSPQRGRISIPF